MKIFECSKCGARRHKADYVTVSSCVFIGCDGIMKPLIGKYDIGDVLKRILNLPYVESELAYLDKGVGTKTENKVWLEAREIVYDLGI